MGFALRAFSSGKSASLLRCLPLVPSGPLSAPGFPETSVFPLASKVSSFPKAVHFLQEFFILPKVRALSALTFQSLLPFRGLDALLHQSSPAVIRAITAQPCYRPSPLAALSSASEFSSLEGPGYDLSVPLLS
jgi:hypothetical protein